MAPTHPPPPLFCWSSPHAKHHWSRLLTSSHCSGDCAHVKQSFCQLFLPRRRGSPLSIPLKMAILLSVCSPAAQIASLCVLLLHRPVGRIHLWQVRREPRECREWRPQRMMRTVCFHGVPFFQGSPSTFQTIKCYCCKWGNWGLNKLSSFLRDAWLMTQKNAATCFSHFQSLQKSVIYNLKSVANAKLWSPFSSSEQVSFLDCPSYLTSPSSPSQGSACPVSEGPSLMQFQWQSCALEKQGQKGH